MAVCRDQQATAGQIQVLIFDTGESFGCLVPKGFNLRMEDEIIIDESELVFESSFKEEMEEPQQKGSKCEPERSATNKQSSPSLGNSWRG